MAMTVSMSPIVSVSCRPASRASSRLRTMAVEARAAAGVRSCSKDRKSESLTMFLR